MTVRESNFELLRNLSMLMVLVIHANFICLQRPMTDDLIADPISTSFRYFIESLGIVCIDVFVLISGWFRIHTTTKRVVKFVFQVLFFFGGGYLVCLVLGMTKLSLNGFLNTIAFTRWDWFIKSYAFLFIIGPVLNTFLDYASEKQIKSVVIAFFLFQSTYGWIGGGSRFFVNGYGPLSFIGLYLLANYTRRVSTIGRSVLFNFPKHIYLLIYFVSAILNTLISLAFLRAGRDFGQIIYAYCNPLIIIGALSLFLFFSKLRIKQNSFINWLGASSFSVYLLHSQINLRDVFTQVIVKLDSMFIGVFSVGVVFLFLLVTFLVSVIVDQIRIWIWNHIDKHWSFKDVQACH